MNFEGEKIFIDSQRTRQATQSGQWPKLSKELIKQDRGISSLGKAEQSTAFDDWSLSKVDLRHSHHRPIASLSAKSDRNKYCGPKMLISSTEQLPDQIGQEFDTDMSAPLTFGLFCELNMRLWRVAIPAILSQLVIIMIETTSMIFIG